jgi:hypothetical protein
MVLHVPNQYAFQSDQDQRRREASAMSARPSRRGRDEHRAVLIRFMWAALLVPLVALLLLFARTFG